MFASAVDRRHLLERQWTEHLATGTGAVRLLDCVRRAPLPEPLRTTLDDIVLELSRGSDGDQAHPAEPALTHLVTHQLRVDGRFPDVVVHDRRDRLFAVIEAQRGRADDRHIAKLAARYVPNSGARLGILVAERWSPSSARHPAWTVCPAPVVVVVALDALHEIDYRVAWVHHPTEVDGV